MKNVDVILNVYSSISVDALKYNIPVISISKFIKWDKAVIKKEIMDQTRYMVQRSWN